MTIGSHTMTHPNLPSAGVIDAGRDLTIFGEFLKYNRELGWVDAHDGVRLQLGVDRFFGPKLRYNMLDDTGVFEQPQYLLRRQNTARGRPRQY